MCGIIACISKKDKNVDEALLIRASERMRHRGPDASGVFTSGWIGMAHNRLSIIDLSREADQPMYSRDRRYVIVYNGEIYNYKELREELVKEGVLFNTQSDTEVLLNSYIRYSSDCLKKLRGMFAFVIADLKKREVFMARDHFGIKPLYIYKSEDYILFSSEIKAISEFVTLAPNYETCFEQIMFRDIAGERTCFKDIEKARPGSFLIYKKDSGALIERQFYTLKETFASHPEDAHKDERGLIEEVDAVLTESVKAHTQSDVGYNLELSGGLDSSLISAILVKRLNCGNLTSYSVIFNEKRYDESAFQDRVAALLGIKKEQIEISNSLYAGLLEKAIYFLEKPLVHSGSPCLYYLTMHSASDSKVILTGEGADELFGGYSRYRIPARLRFFRILNMMALDIVYPFRDIFQKEILRHTAIYGWHEMARVLNGRPILDKSVSYREQVLSEGPKDDLRENLLYYDQKTYLTSLLERQDKLSMANSVEARVPYTDVKVYEFVNSIPIFKKLKDNTLKYILKKVAERYLPPDIVHKEKNGLRLPLEEWLKDRRFLGRYLDILLDGSTKKRGIYNTAYIEKMVRRYREKEAVFPMKLWTLIMFELWHRIFIDNRGGAS